MKALFYLLDGASNASTRHRVLQYFPFLRAHGIDPTASLPVPDRLYDRLLEHGGGTPREKALFYGLFLARRLIHVLQARRFDVVVIQRDLFPFGSPVLERLLTRTGTPLVYDTDDATYIRPAFTPNTPFQRWRRFDKVAHVVASARWVSVATEPIAAWARQYNHNVSVVPMAIDLARYDQARSLRGSGRSPVQERTVLGWAGTAGGLRYLEALAPVLADVARRHDIIVRVVSGGHDRVRLPGVPVETRPWHADTELDDMADMAIGLVPLDDAPFERAKFPFKLLQYWAMGVPAVCARVGLASSAIVDGDNGVLAGSADEWRSALEQLLTDARLRARVADGGRATVEARYTIERVGPILVNGLRAAVEAKEISAS